MEAKLTATDPDGIGINEVWRAVCETRDAVKDLGVSVAGLQVSVVELREQFRAHVAAQDGRTSRRDERCVRSEVSVQALDGRVRAVEAAAAASGGEHAQEQRSRSAWPVVAGLVVSVVALVVSVAIALHSGGQ